MTLYDNDKPQKTQQNLIKTAQHFKKQQNIRRDDEIKHFKVQIPQRCHDSLIQLHAWCII